MTDRTALIFYAIVLWWLVGFIAMIAIEKIKTGKTVRQCLSPGRSDKDNLLMHNGLCAITVPLFGFMLWYAFLRTRRQIKTEQA